MTILNARAQRSRNLHAVFTNPRGAKELSELQQSPVSGCSRSMGTASCHQPRGRRTLTLSRAFEEAGCNRHMDGIDACELLLRSDRP